jgi:hypothetical protein
MVPLTVWPAAGLAKLVIGPVLPPPALTVYWRFSHWP